MERRNKHVKTNKRITKLRQTSKHWETKMFNLFVNTQECSIINTVGQCFHIERNLKRKSHIIPKILDLYKIINITPVLVVNL